MQFKYTHTFSFVNMKILRTDTTVELKIGDVLKTLGNVCSEIPTEDSIYSVLLTATSGVVFWSGSHHNHYLPLQNVPLS